MIRDRFSFLSHVIISVLNKQLKNRSGSEGEFSWRACWNFQSDEAEDHLDVRTSQSSCKFVRETR